MNCAMLFLIIGACLIASAQAQQLVASGVSCADRKIIVNTNNDLRRQVAKGALAGQPKASNMLQVMWDDYLGNMAQAWANKMVFQHNPKRQDARFAVGENIYMTMTSSSTPGFDWKSANLNWFNENTKYTYKQMVSDPSTGHYTQVVWSNTEYIGCGAAQYKATDGRYNKIYVCNYGPAGNWMGQYPYKTGSGCDSMCCVKTCSKNLYGSNC